jgi:hypothetical protein
VLIELTDSGKKLFKETASQLKGAALFVRINKLTTTSHIYVMSVYHIFCRFCGYELIHTLDKASASALIHTSIMQRQISV